MKLAFTDRRRCSARTPGACTQSEGAGAIGATPGGDPARGSQGWGFTRRREIKIQGRRRGCL